MASKFKVEFPAEIKQVSVKKLVSLDKEYRIVLSTADQTCMLLDSFDTDVLVNVVVSLEGAP